MQMFNPDPQDCDAIERKHGPLPENASATMAAERYRLAQMEKLARLLKEGRLIDCGATDKNAPAEQRAEELLRFFLEGVTTQASDAVNRARALSALRADYRARVTSARASALLPRLVAEIADHCAGAERAVSSGGAHQRAGRAADDRC